MRFYCRLADRSFTKRCMEGEHRMLNPYVRGRLNEQDKIEVIELLKKGHSVLSVADKFGMSTAAIYAMITRQKIIDSVGEDFKTGRLVYDEKVLLEKYIKEGKYISEICVLLRRTRACIATEIYRSSGSMATYSAEKSVVKQVNKRMRSVKFSLSPEKKEELKALITAKLTEKENIKPEIEPEIKSTQHTEPTQDTDYSNLLMRVECLEMQIQILSQSIQGK